VEEGRITRFAAFRTIDHLSDFVDLIVFAEIHAGFRLLSK
jgi:hypothetical protein